MVGKRQRERWSKEEIPRHTSHTCNFIVQMIVLGHLSPVMGRDIAEKVLMDIELAKSHDITRELKRLAASGSNGKCKNNIYRDVYKHVLRAPLLVPVLVQFPYRCIGIEGKMGVGTASLAVAAFSNGAIVHDCKRVLGATFHAFSRMHTRVLVRHGQ